MPPVSERSMHSSLVPHVPAPACAAPVLVLVIALAVASPAHAAKPTNITIGETAMLPAYCPDTQGFGAYGDATNPSPRAGHWVRLMGKSFWAMHHHCYGLVKLRRATLPGTPARVRSFELSNAVDEFNYVIQNSGSDFIMLPEVYLRRGDAQVLLGDVVGAGESFEASRRAKPDYAPAYTHWADELFRAGAKKNAITTLEAGLRVAPNSPQLRAHYTKLGGSIETFLKSLPVAAQPSASGPAEAAPAAAAQAAPVAADQAASAAMR